MVRSLVTKVSGYECDQYNVSHPILNIDPNNAGFMERRVEGRKGGIELIKILEDLNEESISIDVVSHSMGYAYALGVLDVLDESGLNIQYDRFYTLAPENACGGGFTLTNFNEVWQYGSNLGQIDEDPCYQQDGVAPQSGVPDLAETGTVTPLQYGRAFLPKTVRKGFVESHSLDSYYWIFGLPQGRPGYIDLKN